MIQSRLGGGARWVVAAISSFQRYICNFKMMTMMAKIMNGHEDDDVGDGDGRKQN